MRLEGNRILSDDNKVIAEKKEGMVTGYPKMILFLYLTY